MTESGKYAVWDWPVRITHWLFAVAVAVMWWSGETGRMELHGTVGLGILTLAVARILWGLWGSYHARFRNFLRGPVGIRAYLRNPQPTVGHNPLGALSVLAFLLLLVIQGSTGLFSADDVAFEGPLAYWAGDMSASLSEWHEVNWGVLRSLIFLHLAVVAWYQWRKHQPLIQAMVFGKAEGKASSQPNRPLWLWILGLAVCAGLLALLISIAPEAPSYY